MPLAKRPPTKSQRRRLARTYSGDPRTAKITMQRKLPGSSAKPGDDVSEEARGWNNIRILLKKGWVTMEPLVDFRTLAGSIDAMPSKAPTEPTPEAPSPAPTEEPQGGHSPDPEAGEAENGTTQKPALSPELLDLKRLNARTGITDIRVALEAAGVEFTEEEGKSKPKLLQRAAEAVLLVGT